MHKKCRAKVAMHFNHWQKKISYTFSIIEKVKRNEYETFKNRPTDWLVFFDQGLSLLHFTCQIQYPNTQTTIAQWSLFFTKVPTSLRCFKNPVSSQTEKLMAGVRFSDYLGLNHYKKANKVKHFTHFRIWDLSIVCL